MRRIVLPAFVLALASACSSSSSSGGDSSAGAGAPGVGGAAGASATGGGAAGASATAGAAGDSSAGGAGSSGAAGAGGACGMESGAIACDDIITARCTRLTECCKGVIAPGTACKYGDVTGCKAGAVQAGIDCAKAGNTMVCKALADSCSSALLTTACSDVMGGTTPDPATCKALGF